MLPDVNALNKAVTAKFSTEHLYGRAGDVIRTGVPGGLSANGRGLPRHPPTRSDEWP
jgi:hypothetical protein